jgi:hypothetical protein
VKDPYNRDDRGPGVPEAVPHCLQRVAAALGVEALDRIWVFPPLVSGRSESGLLAVSHFPPEAEDGDRRLLSILPYTAERTGKGLTVEGELSEQGEAPLDRFPRVMEGVVRRTDLDLGDPEELEIEGRDEAFQEILGGYDRALLDPTLPPVAEPVPVDESEPGAEAAAAQSGEAGATAAGTGGTGPGRKTDGAAPETLAHVLLAGDALAEPEASAEPGSEPEDELYDLYTSGSQ